MFRRALALFLAAGMMAEFAGAGSALFTGTASVAANSFTTGTVVISTSPTSALVTFSNMAPGDQVTAPVTVSNAGSLQLRYAITDTATNDDGKGLAGQLQLTIKSGLTAPNCTNAGFGGGGTIINNGGAAFALANTDGSTKNLVGDPAQGAQTGDRTLDLTESQVLCFNVLLPGSTGNAFQNATTAATFIFAAEQTKNN